MSISYVEAMIDFGAGAGPNIPEADHDGTSARLDNTAAAKSIREAIRKYLPTDFPEVSLNDIADAAADAINDADIEVDISCSLDDYTPPEESGAPLDKVSSSESIARQLFTANFLQGEVIVIMREADFKRLIAPVSKDVHAEVVAHGDPCTVCGGCQFICAEAVP